MRFRIPLGAMILAGAAVTVPASRAVVPRVSFVEEFGFSS